MAAGSLSPKNPKNVVVEADAGHVAPSDDIHRKNGKAARKSTGTMLPLPSLLPQMHGATRTDELSPMRGALSPVNLTPRRKQEHLAEDNTTSADDIAVGEKCGALVEGGKVNIFEWRNIGFLLQYFAVGCIQGGLPSTIYGVFLGYLNVPGYIYATATVITTLPWSFKFFFGILNDCVPIFGYRRKPYMLIGWSMCCGMLIVISQLALPDPHYCRDADGFYMKTSEPCNPDAADSAGKFAMLMCLAALGYVIADVAADGLMVEYAQREPEESRGSIQTMIYLVRAIGMVSSVALVGLGMNGKQYNGSFDVSLTFNQVAGILAGPCALMVPASWFLVQEQCIARADRKPLRSYLVSAWDLLTNRAFFFVVMYQFWEPFIGRISTTAGGMVKQEWAGVQVLQQQMFTLFSLFLFAGGLWLVKRHLLNVDWRWLLFTTTIFLNVVDSVFAYLTIYDVVRNQYFYLGETVLEEIPAAANFVVSTFIIVEMADQGNEGMVYGLLTTISNLGSPFSRAVGNQIFGLFKPDLSDNNNYISDEPSFRNTVALSFGVSYAFSFAAMVFLLLLPKQKQEAQKRKREWPKRQLYGYVTLALVGCAFTYSITVNLMTMFPESACLKFVGGPGC